MLAIGEAEGDGVAGGERGGVLDDDAVAEGEGVAALEEQVGGGEADVLLAELEGVAATHEQAVRGAAEALRQGGDAFAVALDELGNGGEACREAMPLRATALDVTRDQEREARGYGVEGLLLTFDVGVGGMAKAIAELGQLGEAKGHAIDEEGGHGCGRLEARVSHEVDYGVVAFVTDAGDDGQGELRAVGGEGVGVEAAEVGCGAAAADDGDGVECLVVRVNPIQGGDDAGLGALALHEGGVELDIKREAVFVV